MRLLILVLLSLSLATSAFAQDTNTTPGDETNTTTEGNATEGDATEGGGDAPAPGPIEILFEGTNDLKFRDSTGRTNPTLTVLPGQKVTFILRSVGGVHNLNIGGEVKTDFLSEGEEARLEWTAPTEEGRVEYWCDPHRTSGMRGVIQVGEAPASGGGGGGAGGEQGQISGETVDLGRYNPQCQGVLAPAIVTTGITGAPTLDDYIQQCLAGDQPVSTERAKSGADYVIPISWLLIGLGVVGVVWVHKYYKP